MEHIGIIGAMDVEVDGLISELKNARMQTFFDLCVHTGELQGKKVSIVRCGVGKVNAAFCSTILINNCACDCLINTGVAGSVDMAVGVGDVVVATDAIHHDVDVSALSYTPGQVPGMDTLAYPMDKRMHDIVMALDVPTKLISGRIASGEQFIADALSRKVIHDDFSALCAEMEGAAIAQVAYRAKVPVLILRSISDNADGSSPVEYPEFEAAAAAISTQITKALVKRI